MFSFRHFWGRKITAGTDKAMGEVATGAQEFQDEPGEEEDGNEDCVEDEEDQG